jgi:hypothetical protein
MKIISNNKILFVSFLLSILFSFNLSIPQLVQSTNGLSSAHISETAAKNDPFYKTARADQIIYDFFPSTDKIESDTNTNELINQLINSLIQEKVAKPEICGDGQDNDGNGAVDEYCNVSNVPQDDNQSPQVEPGQEICGDGQDNDGNGAVDENCNIGNVPQDDNQSPQVEPEQEICGDGQDNDGNGAVDENCNIGNVPQDDNQSPQVEPEQEICGDGQDNDGNGAVDENCNIGNVPQDDNQATEGKKKFDKFGILNIYPTKQDGEQWYFKSSPDSDPHFSPQTKLEKNSDGSFKVKSSKVRMGVFTSSGFHPEKISTLNHNRIALAGYMQSPNDWRDVEITGYVKLNSGTNDNFVWYARGGRHTGYGSPQGCEGVAYKGELFYDGSTRWTKEQWHTGGYVFGEFGKNIGSIKGKWVGFKVIMYNIVQNDKTAVKLELWVDKNNNNDWKKATEKTDKGGWGSTGSECGGKPDQIITWGGPIAAFRWDGATDVDIKNFSVREIVPTL